MRLLGEASLTEGREARFVDRSKGLVLRRRADQTADEGDLSGQISAVGLSSPLSDSTSKRAANLPGSLEQHPLEPLFEPGDIDPHRLRESVRLTAAFRQSHPIERRTLPEQRSQIIGIGPRPQVLKVDESDTPVRREEVVRVEVAVAENAGMGLDLPRERIRPLVVRRSMLRRQRSVEPQVEYGFARKIELPAERRGVERRVDARIGEAGDDGRGIDRM